MEVRVTEKVFATKDELEVIKKATQMHSEIKNSLTDSTFVIDKQEFPDEIESLLMVALDLENTRIFSTFNNLPSDARDKLSRVICV